MLLGCNFSFFFFPFSFSPFFFFVFLVGLYQVLFFLLLYVLLYMYCELIISRWHPSYIAFVLVIHFLMLILTCPNCTLPRNGNCFLKQARGIRPRLLHARGAHLKWYLLIGQLAAVPVRQGRSSPVLIIIII